MIAPALPNVAYVPNPMFLAENADELVESLRPPGDTAPADCGSDGCDQVTTGIVPEQLPATLSREEERYLFCRMNFLRFQAAQINEDSERHQQAVQLWDRRATLLGEADAIRDRIVHSNLRLVAALAGRFATPVFTAEELFSEGCVPLLRAVELFDFSRGLCFSTYATHAVRHCFFRYLKKGAKRGRLHTWTNPSTLDTAPSQLTNATELLQTARTAQNFIGKLLQALPKREQLIVSARWGLGDNEVTHTYEQIGRRLGLSKERVRVLAHRSMAKLQQFASDERLELPC